MGEHDSAEAAVAAVPLVFLAFGPSSLGPMAAALGPEAMLVAVALASAAVVVAAQWAQGATFVVQREEEEEEPPGPKVVPQLAVVASEPERLETVTGRLKLISFSGRGAQLAKLAR